MRTGLELFFTVKIGALRDDFDLAMDGLQCPGEPYTISRLICRGRQAKGYVKCPGCSNREAATEVIRIQPPPSVPALAAPSPSRVRVPVPAAAYRMPVPEASGADSGLMALARRLYDYF